MLAVLSLALSAGTAFATPTWSLQTTPNEGEEDNVLTGVSCTSTEACTAVGFHISAGISRTLAERFE
jgi:hypothetical protein